jgi:hypothetical protein
MLLLRNTWSSALQMRKGELIFLRMPTLSVVRTQALVARGARFRLGQASISHLTLDDVVNYFLP